MSIARLMQMASAGVSAAGGIRYVGGTTSSFSGSATNRVVSLTSLTGGLSSAPATDDLVVVYFGVATQNRNPDLVVGGYVEVADNYRDDTYDANLAVAYKFMGATPDTTVTIVGGTGNSADAGAVAIQVFRGVDKTTPLDVSNVGTVVINTVIPDPGAITPITSGAVILAGGSGAHTQGGSQTYSSPDLTNFISISGNDSNDVTVGLGYHFWTSGSFDPAPFTFSGGDSASFSALAQTLALRPE